MGEWAITSTRVGLDRAELLTTALAVVVSGSCWAVFGAPYLARGVVGDSLGVMVLAGALLLTGRRLRHEALLCLVGIGLVHLAGWEWPLGLPSAVWAAVFLVDVLLYLLLRAGVLRPREAAA